MATSEDRQAAALTREKYQFYLDTAGPVEDQVFGDLFSTGAINRQIAEAKGMVTSGFQAGRNSTADFRQRYGDMRSEEEKAFEDRRSQIREALAQGETSDNVRAMGFERDVNTSVDMARLGRGMASSAEQGMLDAARRRNERDATNDQIAQGKNNTIAGSAMTGVATGATVGGPWGAVIGGAIGLGAGVAATS
jgi:hypothetical protein